MNILLIVLGIIPALGAALGALLGAILEIAIIAFALYLLIIFIRDMITGKRSFQTERVPGEGLVITLVTKKKKGIPGGVRK